ncbi:MAG: M28 family peptidase [Clostridiaceae bacterium]|nr:M28 family peptidase [Clostridiaceae bacterium]
MKRNPIFIHRLNGGCRLVLNGLLFVLMMMMVLPVSGCQSTEETTASVAAYGTYGSELAKQLAADYPYRSPGSEQETAAGDFLIDSLKALGYQPVVTTFNFQDASGQTLTSRNIAVTIQGRGFTVTDKDGKTGKADHQVIIGAHYDTKISAADAAAAQQTAGTAAAGETAAAAEPTLADCDGIHDNASGVGALMTLAKQLRSESLGYDVVLVAFGAGEAAQAGSADYAAQMSAADLTRTDAMYCLDSIYAGDKIYAHAGRNSLKAGYQKDYEKRRKLYEVTDVFYDNELYTKNNYMLYTNQSSIDVTVEGIEGSVLYREWTLTASDYLPFDTKGIPIVFFESYDYDEKTLEEMKESNNPAFATTGGAIRHTCFDSTRYLTQILTQTRSTAPTDSAAVTIDQLTKRINNTAFIILEAIRKGMTGAAVN